MQQPEHVAVFWDFGTPSLVSEYAGTDASTENLPPRSGAPGHKTVQAIRSLAHDFGIITSFKAYLEVSPSLGLWSELQASGVALVDCPHRGRAEAASKMLLVDMITFTIDHPAPATILLISEDRDLAYAISTLRHRKFKVVLLCPADAPDSLVAQADAHFDWEANVLHGSGGDELPLAPSPAPQRARCLSTSSNKVSNSDRKGKDREINNADLRTSHRDNRSCSYSNRHEHTLPNTTNLCRTSSRTTSAGMLQSPESSARTFSPLPKHKPTDEDIVVESSSQPDRRKSFPFLEDETWKESRDLQTSSPAPANTTVKASPLAYKPPSAPSLGASNLQQPFTLTATSTPAATPVLSTIGVPVAVTPAATPARSTIGVPVAVTPAATPARSTISVPVTITPTATPARSTIGAPVPSTTVFATPRSNTEASHKSIPTPAQQHSERPTPPMPAVARPAPSHFLPLINALQKRAREQKQTQITRSDLGVDLAKFKGLYAQAKVSKFASYMLLAEEAGIVMFGGSGSDSWVSLRPEWASSSIFPS
ncbi:hypothetical protein C0992_010693 [Termitomyces sp. T32_za158]|nr:hypothetical protein C0992_010693 [Termitomyces sp. T32_za158]